MGLGIIIQMKLQQKSIVLDPKLYLSGVKELYRAGFSSTAGFAAKDRMFVYACGKNVVLDSYDNNNQVQLAAHDAPVSCTCVANNSVIASGQLASPGNKNYDSQIFLWKVGDREPIARFLGLKEGVKALLFSEDCRYLAGVSHKDQLMVWDLKTQSQLLTKNFENPILILNFSNDSIVLVIGKGIHSLSLTPLLTQNKPPALSNFTLPNTGLPRVYTCLASLGNGVLVIGTESGELCVFSKGIFKSGLVAGKGRVSSIGLCNAKQLVASVGNELVRFDVLGEQLKQKDRRTVELINSIAISEKGQIFAMSGNSISKISPELKVQTIKVSHNSRVNHAHYKNGTIASIDESGTLICRYHKGGDTGVINLWKYPQPKTPGRCVEVHANGILAGFNDGKLVNLTLDCSKAQWELNAHKGPVTTISTSQAYFLTGGEDCVVRIWSKNRQLINQISAHQKTVSRVLGDLIASHLVHSCSLDRSIQTYDLKADKKLYFKQAQGGNLTDLIQDHKVGDLITCGVGSAVSFWKPQDHQPYRSLVVDNSHAIKLALNPSATILALGCENGAISLFSIKNNSHLGMFKAHSGAITGLSWISEGSFLSSGEDNCVAVWSWQ